MNENRVVDLDLPRQMTRARRLTRHVWTHFKEDRCLEEAASLSYTSLLSLVPLLAVVFGIVAAFPVFEDWSERLKSFIFDNFLPDTGQQIVPYLDSFLNSVSSLTLPGTVGLIVAALLLMIRIEVALNRIWRVERNRSLINRVVMYWAVLTLAPILIAAAVAISAQQLFSAVMLDEAGSPVLYRLGKFVLTWLVFAMFFVLVPNRRVQIRHALAGALLSAVLFELARAGFVAFVSNTNYKVIYGALATVPIFLIWLYLVWNVILFGASLAASLTTFSDYSRYETSWPRRWDFQMAFRLVGHFWAAQRDGHTLSHLQLLELERQASELQLLRLVDSMIEARILAADEDGNWMLNRDLSDLTLGELYALGDYFLPLGETDALPRESSVDDVYVDCLKSVHDSGQTTWNRPLRSLYLQSEGNGESNENSG
jgi:membrane protein